jgi:hypothetical protein
MRRIDGRLIFQRLRPWCDLHVFSLVRQ